MTLPLESPLSAGAQPEKPEREMLADRAPRHRARISRRATRSRRRIASSSTSGSRCRWPRWCSSSSASRSASASHRGGRAVALASSFAIVVAYYIVFTVARGPGAEPPPARAARDLAAEHPLRPPRPRPAPRATTADVSAAWADALLASLGARRPRPWPRCGVGADARVGAGGALRGPRASTFLIDRYLIREYSDLPRLRPGVGAALFVVVDLLQTLDRFLRVKPRSG